MSSQKSSITQAEVEKYWEIFSSLAQGDAFLTGAQAASVLKNSQLSDHELESIWDLADVDDDGKLDFEEFCVAMRLVFDLVNGDMRTVPQTLPEWLVPESKAFLIPARNALVSRNIPRDLPLPLTRMSAPNGRAPKDDRDVDDLKTGFDWYMSPESVLRYTAIYTQYKDSRGELHFGALKPLYEELDLPENELHQAWSLVCTDPDQSSIIKNTALAYLHLLSLRYEGYQLPRTVPASLRATFAASTVPRKYLDRDTSPQNLPTAPRTQLRPRLTDRSHTYDEERNLGDDESTTFKPQRDHDWEVNMLKNDLSHVEKEINKLEHVKTSRQKETTLGQDIEELNLVKQDLVPMLAWKTRELGLLKMTSGARNSDIELQSVETELTNLQDLVVSLEKHLDNRETCFRDIKTQISENLSTGSK